MGLSHRRGRLTMSNPKGNMGIDRKALKEIHNIPDKAVREYLLEKLKWQNYHSKNYK